MGALLIKRWELAPVLESCVLMHHEPELLLTEDEDMRGLAYCVALADEICHREGLGTQAREFDYALEEGEAAIALGFEAEHFPPLVAKIREAFEQDQQLFK